MTTLDALWMGAPLVSMSGRAAFSRAGLSILSNLGLGELVTEDSEQFVQIAISLATDLGRLSGLRSNLRQRMRTSPLTDAPRFSRDIEAAYREIWRGWCGVG
jgi:predicted O-linked N-acetylglucosamine transferase (SPINDLY family)